MEVVTEFVLKLRILNSCVLIAIFWLNTLLLLELQVNVFAAMAKSKSHLSKIRVNTRV